MRLPGFTAANSLYHRTGDFSVGRDKSLSEDITSRSNVVVPQLFGFIKKHKCLLWYYACLAPCAGTGLAAIPCAAACAANFYSCKTS